MKYILLILFAFIYIEGNAKLLSADSLKIYRSRVAVIDSTDNVEDYVRIISHFKPEFIDSINVYLDKLKKYVELKPLPRNKALMLFEQAHVLWWNRKLEDSQACLKEALEINKSLNDTARTAWCYERMAVNEFYASEYDQVIALSFKSLELYEKINSPVHIANLYNMISASHRRLKQDDLALEYALKNIEFTEKIGNKSKQGMSYQSVAGIYMQQKNDSIAEEYYLKALACYDDKKPAHATHMAIIRLNLGVIYTVYRGEHERALIELEKCKKQFEERKIYASLAFTLKVQSGAENFLGNYAASDKHLAEAYELQKKTANKRVLHTIMTQEFSNLEHRGNFKKAYEVLKKSQALKDTIFSAQKAKDAANIREKYEAEKKEREIEILKADEELRELNMQQQEDGRRVMLFLSAFLVLVISSVVWLYIRQKRIGALLKESEARLSETNASKDKFFSIIAHDLKNPFHSILGSSDLLINCFDNVPKKMLFQNLKNIHSAADQVYRLIDNLLAWAGSQINRMKYEPAEFDILHLVDDVKNAIEPLATEKEINVDWPTDTPLVVTADFNMLETVVRNIMSNAIKFTPNNGQVKLNYKLDAGNLHIDIEDTGIGMEQEDADKIFLIDSKFQRDGTNDESGSGLGLIVCKEFIDKHKGAINVTSEVDHGSCFTIIIPQ